MPEELKWALRILVLVAAALLVHAWRRFLRTRKAESRFQIAVQRQKERERRHDRLFGKMLIDQEWEDQLERWRKHYEAKRQGAPRT